jgi:hypothetical protein
MSKGSMMRDFKKAKQKAVAVIPMPHLKQADKLNGVIFGINTKTMATEHFIYMVLLVMVLVVKTFILNTI